MPHTNQKDNSSKKATNPSKKTANGPVINTRSSLYTIYSLKFYKTQEDVKSLFQDNNIIVSKDIYNKQKDIVKSFALCRDFIYLYHYSKQLSPPNNNLYEVIPPSSPQKPRFDLDFNASLYSFKESQKCLDALLLSIEIVFKRFNIPYSFDTHCIVCSAHSPSHLPPTKYSYHIIIDKYAHLDCKEASAFFDLVYVEVAKIIDNPVWLDKSVYKSYQQFRCLWSQKINSGRPKTIDPITTYVPSEIDDDPKDADKLRDLRYFSACLLSVTTNCKTLPSFIPQPVAKIATKDDMINAIAYSIFCNSHSTDDITPISFEEIKKSIDPGTLPDNFQLSSEFTFDPVNKKPFTIIITPQMSDKIEQIFLKQSFSNQFTFPTNYYDRSNFTCISLKRKHSGRCPIHTNKIHENENAYLKLDRYGRIWFNCFRQYGNEESKGIILNLDDKIEIKNNNEEDEENAEIDEDSNEGAGLYVNNVLFNPRPQIASTGSNVNNVLFNPRPQIPSTGQNVNNVLFNPLPQIGTTGSNVRPFASRDIACYRTNETYKIITYNPHQDMSVTAPSTSATSPSASTSVPTHIQTTNIQIYSIEEFCKDFLIEQQGVDVNVEDIRQAYLKVCILKNLESGNAESRYFWGYLPEHIKLNIKRTKSGDERANVLVNYTIKNFIPQQVGTNVPSQNVQVPRLQIRVNGQNVVNQGICLDQYNPIFDKNRESITRGQLTGVPRHFDRRGTETYKILTDNSGKIMLDNEPIKMSQFLTKNKVFYSLNDFIDEFLIEQQGVDVNVEDIRQTYLKVCLIKNLQAGVTEPKHFTKYFPEHIKSKIKRTRSGKHSKQMLMGYTLKQYTPPVENVPVEQTQNVETPQQQPKQQRPVTEILTQFFKDKTIQSDHKFVTTKVLYKEWVESCKITGIFQPYKSQKAFTLGVRDHYGYQTGKSKRGETVLLGLMHIEDHCREVAAKARRKALFKTCRLKPLKSAKILKDEKMLRVNEMVNNPNQYLLILKAVCGMGKSQLFFKYIKENMKKFKSVLFVVGRTMLGRSVMDDLKKLGFVYYEDVKNTKGVIRDDYVVCQVDSLPFLDPKDSKYDLVIFDEWCTEMAHFVHFVKQKHAVNDMIERLLIMTPRVIISDALIKDEHVKIIKRIRNEINADQSKIDAHVSEGVKDFLSKMKNIPEKMKKRMMENIRQNKHKGEENDNGDVSVYHYVHKMHEGKKFEMLNKKSWLETLMQKVGEGRKIFVPCNIANMCNYIHEEIKRVYPTVKVVMYTAETKDKIMGDEIEGTEIVAIEPKKEIEGDTIIEVWKKNQVIIYSPCIEAGISYIGDSDEMIFGYFSRNSCGPESALQMLMRCRTAKEMKIHVDMKVGKRDLLCKSKYLKTEEDYCEYVCKNYEAKPSQIVFKREREGNGINTLDNYFKLYCLIAREQRNGFDRYDEILGQYLLQMGIKCEGFEDEIEEKEELEGYKEMIKEKKEREWEMISKEEIMIRQEYMELKESKKKTSDDMRRIRKCQTIEQYKVVSFDGEFGMEGNKMRLQHKNAMIYMEAGDYEMEDERYKEILKRGGRIINGMDRRSYFVSELMEDRKREQRAQMCEIAMNILMMIQRNGNRKNPFKEEIDGICDRGCDKVYEYMEAEKEMIMGYFEQAPRVKRMYREMEGIKERDKNGWNLMSEIVKKIYGFKSKKNTKELGNRKLRSTFRYEEGRLMPGKGKYSRRCNIETGEILEENEIYKEYMRDEWEERAEREEKERKENEKYERRKRERYEKEVEKREIEGNEW